MNGFASRPYPLETARYVVQASKAAPLCPASAHPYQIFLCRGVSRGRVNTGLTGRKGCVAAFGVMGCGSAFTLGAGAEARDATRVESFAALSEATAGESLTTFAVSSICGMVQIRRSTVMTICHLSIARGSCKSVPTRNEANLLFKWSGSTGLSVSF